MLVTVTGFGSVWRRRFGKNQSDPRRFARAAYFNTTGVPVNGKIRTRPRIVGHVRFNGVGGFDPNRPLGMINSVFECAGPCIWQGQNKILFKRMLLAPQQPDYFLVVVARVTSKTRPGSWITISRHRTGKVRAKSASRRAAAPTG